MHHHLQSNGLKCNQAPGDADVLIARKGVEVSTVGPTCVIAEDTDVLVLLIHHAFCATVPARCLYFRSDRHNSKHGVWDIGAVCEALGEELCRTLPFVHATAGCDSTSRLFGIGKGLPLKKMKQPSFRTHAEVFCGDEVPSKTSIIQAGEKSLVCMYGGTDQDDLDRLRVRKFKEKAVTSASSVKMQSLPPTRDAAKYHPLRVLYQVRVWKGMDVGRDPLEWGWFEKSNRLWPCMTDSPPASERILKVVRCQCKGDCDSKCCSCRRYGFECNDACTNCKGGGCTNHSVESFEGEDED